MNWWSLAGANGSRGAPCRPASAQVLSRAREDACSSRTDSDLCCMGRAGPGGSREWSRPWPSTSSLDMGVRVGCSALVSVSQPAKLPWGRYAPHCKAGSTPSPKTQGLGCLWVSRLSPQHRPASPQPRRKWGPELTLSLPSAGPTLERAQGPQVQGLPSSTGDTATPDILLCPSTTSGRREEVSEWAESCWPWPSWDSGHGTRCLRAPHTAGRCPLTLGPSAHIMHAHPWLVTEKLRPFSQPVHPPALGGVTLRLGPPRAAGLVAQTLISF